MLERQLGVCAERSGRFADAEQRYRSAITKLQRAGDFAELGSCFADMGRLMALLDRPVDADQHFRAAARCLRTAPPAHKARLALAQLGARVARAQAVLRAGRKEEAIAEVRAAVEDLERPIESTDPASTLERLADASADLQRERGLVVEQLDDLQVMLARGRALEVARDGSWFRWPGTQTVDLRRRGGPRKLLARLIACRLSSPGVALDTNELIEAAWPASRLAPDILANRVYVALSTLRRLGLDPILARRADGYLLDPDAPVEARDSTVERQA